MSEELMLKVDNVYKKYRLGVIGGGTLTGDLQSWWAKVRHKEDPNSKIGAKVYEKNEEFYALNGISFEVKKGEALGIIGGNGAGKSTTLKLLSQVTAPTEGKIYLNGRIASMLEVGTGFHPELTGRENIYLNGAILGMTKAEIDSKVEEIIDFSECRQFIDTPVKRYSSGMYVKLAFSVAAHLDSEIMIMDEVLAVGDVKFQDKCLNKMKKLAQEEGKTILYVSHNMNTIRTLCSRCIVLKKGNLIYSGDVENGIQIYLDHNVDEDSPEVKLTNFERPGNQTDEALMMHFRFINKNDCVFINNEKMRFNIKWLSKKTTDYIYFKLIIRHVSDMPVGVTISDEIENIEENKEYSNSFEFDLANLAEGKYFASISIFQKDALGRDVLLDHVTRAIGFEIVNQEENKLIWQHKYWGSVKFNNLVQL